jgi:hypothetical protein
MYKDGPLATWLWLLAPEAPVAGGPNDSVTLLNQIEQMSRL